MPSAARQLLRRTVFVQLRVVEKGFFSYFYRDVFSNILKILRAQGGGLRMTIVIFFFFIDQMMMTRRRVCCSRATQYSVPRS